MVNLLITRNIRHFTLYVSVIYPSSFQLVSRICFQYSIKKLLCHIVSDIGSLLLSFRIKDFLVSAIYPKYLCFYEWRNLSSFLNNWCTIVRQWPQILFSLVGKTLVWRYGDEVTKNCNHINLSRCFEVTLGA